MNSVRFPNDKFNVQTRPFRIFLIKMNQLG